MTAQEYRNAAASADEVVDLALPSGAVVRARRPGPMQFAQWGLLPSLQTVAMHRDDIGADEAADLAGKVRDLLVWCWVEPRISLHPGPDELHPREVRDADWTFTMRWAMRSEEAEAVRPFRGNAGVSDDRSDSGAVLSTAERADGGRGPGTGAGIGHSGDGPAVEGFAG